jgi:hypothetical protein
MASPTPSPLPNLPIVDEQGRPTPAFQQQWEALRQAVLALQKAQAPTP